MHEHKIYPGNHGLINNVQAAHLHARTATDIFVHGVGYPNYERALEMLPAALDRKTYATAITTTLCAVMVVVLGLALYFYFFCGIALYFIYMR